MINHLNLSRCLKLIELVCANNNLIGLDLDNNPKLEVIDVSNNQIRANLSIFSHLKELVNLDLSRGNDFTGSLASLKDCRELAELNISGNKNIRGGLENLPAGEDFFISCQNTDFESQLAGHESRQEGWYFLWKWKWEWRLKRLIETKQKLEKERKGLIISNIILGGLVVLLGAIMAFQHGKNKNQRTKKSDENPTEY